MPPSALAEHCGLARLGAFCARQPVRVLMAWVVLLLATLVGRHIVDPVYSDQVTLPGSPSNVGARLLAASDPVAGSPSGRVVLHVASGTVDAHRAAVGAALAAIERLPHVRAASPLVTSTDGRTAYTTVSFDTQPRALGHGYTELLDQATGPARDAGIEVAYGGELEEVTRPPADDRAGEVVGVTAALLVLLLAFGSVAAAVLPLLTALVSVGVGLGVVGMIAGMVTFATSAPTLATMLGLGVGIDYAVFLTTRFRQELMDGRGPVRAAARSAASSGRAVVVAAITVALALLGLYASGLTFIGKLGLAASIAVVVTAAGALTLVPAALGLVGARIDRFTVRRPVAEPCHDGDRWYRYAALVSRRPWPFLSAGGALLALLSVPLLTMRLGHVDAGADPVGTSSRTAHDLVARSGGPGFGPGANGTFTVVVDLRDATAPASTVAGAVDRAVRGVPGVARSIPARADPRGDLLVATVTPATGPQDAATSALFAALGDRALPDALRGTGARGYVTGSTAGLLDFRNTISERLPLIIGVVLLAAFLLLTCVFRSLLVPLKAVALNLLTTAASYGVLVAVFQWGWGSGALGLSEPVPIESYVPMMMFAIVFGLSMDYEIFLLSRIADTWRATGDNTVAVGTGLAATGRVISSAALIMSAVFLSFAASPTVVIKMLAVGLAVSVVIDATVVRLVLVPSAMVLMGRANWWLPGPLDRVLPHLDA